MLKFLKNKLAYTLDEVVMTTAIVGTLTAVALPNFLRVRTNVQTELVKQHLRVIGEEMNQIFNQTRQFPKDMGSILSGASGEEIVITASLNAIGQKGFTSQYTALENQSRYSLRIDPKPDFSFVQTDKCFILNVETGVRELPCWDGEGLAIASVYDLPLAESSNTISSLVSQDRPDLIEGFLEIYAGWIRFDLLESFKRKNPDGLPGLAFNLPASDVVAFQNMFSKIAACFQDAGMIAYLDSYQPKKENEDLAQLTIGFKYDGPDHRTENYRAYQNYASDIARRANLEAWWNSGHVGPPPE